MGIFTSKKKLAQMEAQRSKMLAQYENVFSVHDFFLNSTPINGKRYVFIGGEVIKGTLQKGDVIIVGNERYTVVVVKKQLDVLAIAKPGEYVYFGVEYATNRVKLPFKKEAIQIVKNQPIIESTPQRTPTHTDAARTSSNLSGACNICEEAPLKQDHLIVKNQPHIENAPQRAPTHTDAARTSSNLSGACNMCGMVPAMKEHLITVGGSQNCSYCYIKKLKETNKFLFSTAESTGSYSGAIIYYFLQPDGRILKVTQEIVTYPFNECDFIADKEYISFDEFHSALKSVSQDI